MDGAVDGRWRGTAQGKTVFHTGQSPDVHDEMLKADCAPTDVTAAPTAFLTASF